MFSVALTIVAPAEQGAEVALLASGLVGVVLSLLLLRLGVLPAISLRASEIVVRSGLRTRRADRSAVCGFYAAEGAWGHRLGISLRDGEPIEAAVDLAVARSNKFDRVVSQCEQWVDSSG